MANRNFRSQFRYGYAVPVDLRMSVSIGASGAPTIDSGTGMGIASIVHNSTGDYSITLSDAYSALLGLRVNFLSGNAAAAAPLVNIRSNAVSTLSAPVLRIQTRDLTGTLADPASGEKMLVVIELNQSSQAY